MHSPHTARPLLSAGQLKAMLDLRLVWDDGPLWQQVVDATSRKGPDVQGSPGKGMTVERETEIKNAESNAWKGQTKRVRFRESGTEKRAKEYYNPRGKSATMR